MSVRAHAVRARFPYLLTGRLAPLGPHVACVDYSAGKGGALVAYRWDGESVLQAANFTST